VLLIDRLRDAKRKAGELCESGDAEKAPLGSWTSIVTQSVQATTTSSADDRLHAVRSTPLEVGTSVDGWLTIARLPAWSLEQLGKAGKRSPPRRSESGCRKEALQSKRRTSLRTHSCTTGSRCLAAIGGTKKGSEAIALGAGSLP
jgi:hypothetical protein